MLQTVGEVPLQSIQSLRKIWTICVPQLSITDLKVKCHYALLSPIFSPLHSVTNEKQYQKCLCNQSSHYRKYGRFPFKIGKPCVVLLRINTLGSQQNEMGHKGGQRYVHDACTVCTAVCQKACLGTKRH